MVKQYSILKLLLLTVSVLTLTHVTQAEVKTFIRDYTYTAGESDSKITSRAIALSMVKRQLLEELGTYIESKTKIINFSIARDEIISLTSGIVQSKIIEEKWTGDTYWLKTQISVDVNDVLNQIKDLKCNRNYSRELFEVKLITDSLLTEILSLKSKIYGTIEPNQIPQLQTKYNKTVNSLSSYEMWVEGNVSLKTGNIKKAIELYNKAISLDNADWRFYHARGLAFHSEIPVNNEAAASDFFKATELNPNNPQIFYLFGITQKNLRKYIEAMHAFNSAIKIDSLYVAAYAQLASCLDKSGNFHDAMNIYRTANIINPKNSEIYTELGTTLIDHKMYNEAKLVLDTAIMLSPYFAENYCLRGIAFGELGDNSKSILDHTKAIQIQPNQPRYYYLRAISFNDIKQYDKALEDLDYVVDKLPHFSDAYYLRGTICLSNNNIEGGKKDLLTAKLLGNKKANELIDKMNY